MLTIEKKIKPGIQKHINPEAVSDVLSSEEFQKYISGLTPFISDGSPGMNDIADSREIPTRILRKTFCEEMVISEGELDLAITFRKSLENKRRPKPTLKKLDEIIIYKMIN